MRRIVHILIFLMFVDENSKTLTAYAETMFTPFGWVYEWLMEPLPIKLRPFDTILIIVGIIAGHKGSRVGPMRMTLFLAIATTILFFAFGVLRGGDARAASWQVYLMLMAPAAAFAISSTHTKASHFRELAKVVVAAGIYRAVMCNIFYFVYVRGSTTGNTMWNMVGHHYDTVLWVVSIGILAVNFLEARTTSAKLAAFLGGPLMLAAIQFNSRRLAWVSLAASMISIFFLLPPSPAKRRLRRIATVMAPLLGLYVIIGWGRPERIFKPLSSLHSVSSKPDDSTLARNVENLSLIATAATRPPTGTGWGHPYVELSNKYTIASAMELWPYVPHNSILGLFAYSGFLGFLGYWLMFPTGVFLHVRTARLAREPIHRSAGLVGVVMTVTCLNQMFGDMGIFSPGTMYMLAICWSGALRIPIEAGVWPGARPIAAVATPAPPAGAAAPAEAAAAPPVG